MSTVGDNIKRLRTAIKVERSMTLAELGKLSGVPLQSIFQYETGHCNPAMRNLKKLAKALNVTMDELAGD